MVKRFAQGDYFKLKKAICFGLLAVSLSACSLDASLTDLTQLSPIAKIQERDEPDFVYGEVVTTGNGTVIQGSFGEISERQELSSGITIEGAFYE